MIKMLFPLAILLLPSAVPAREWPSAGGWDVVEVNSEACVMAMEYDGEGATHLGLVLNIEGKVYILASNYNWSAKKEQAYELVYLLDGVSYSGGKSIGTEDGIRKGFITSFPADFVAEFAKSSGMTIKSKEGVVIDDLSLRGSAAALTVLQRCVAHLKNAAAAEAREKARFAHIPKDPFAEVSGEAIPREPIPPRPIGSLASLISNGDYPSSARVAREQGTTEFRLHVDRNGLVTRCEITKSSGSPDLDAATCRLMQRRARYTPARDSSGNATAGTADERITWKLDP